MKCFFAFEIAGPLRFFKYEKAGPLHRFIFLYFSIIYCNWKWTEFIEGMIKTAQKIEREKYEKI